LVLLSKNQTATATPSFLTTTAAAADSLHFGLHLIHDRFGYKLQNVLVNQHLEVASHLVHDEVCYDGVDAQALREGWKEEENGISD